jgi:crotonobetainyl-CoA:carnitine CoA-transferase CaiB-like acyl-CoA transferase
VGAASFATAGTAVADLVSLVSVAAPAVRVDRRLAAAWLRQWAEPVGGWDRGSPWHGVSTDYPAADGRWIRLQANYPHLRQAVLDTLGVPEDREAIARVIGAMPADEAEQALVDGGAAASASRTVAEWAAHPQGRAVAAEPLIDVTWADKSDDAGAWVPTAERPLAGIRVLDVTRVLAGPVGTRFLAGYGAEVLRIDPPGYAEPGGSSGGRGTFLELLAGADVLVHGLRLGAMDRLGLGAGVRRAASPGHVEVTLNAYGWTGPWTGRRGFDTLVQTSAGMSTEIMRRDGLPSPRLLPAQVLDFATGYLAAAAAVRGLAERARQGRGSSWRLALARTGAVLSGAGRPPEEDEITLPLDGPWEDRVYTFPRGPVRRLEFPVKVDGAPLFWERPGDPYGTAAPVWATAPTAGRR